MGCLDWDLKVWGLAVQDLLGLWDVVFAFLGVGASRALGIKVFWGFQGLETRVPFYWLFRVYTRGSRWFLGSKRESPIMNAPELSRASDIGLSEVWAIAICSTG